MDHDGILDGGGRWRPRDVGKSPNRFGYPARRHADETAAPVAALSDQVRSLDWKARQAERKGQATLPEIADIKAKIKSSLRLA